MINLDTTFGSPNGYVATPTGTIASSVNIQTNGDLIVVGSSITFPFQTVSYDTAGNMLTIFSTTGIPTNFTPEDLVIQPDGKIVIVGQNTNPEFVLVRYNSTGTSLDNSFGTNGVVIGPAGFINAVALDINQNIIVAGGDGTYFNVVRYTPSGVTSATYASGITGYAYDILFQPNGYLLAVGQSEANNFMVVRYDTNGILDPTFGEGGIVAEPSGIATGIALQNDGNIVVAGTNFPNIQVARFVPTGTLDGTYGSNGVAIGSVGEGQHLLLEADQTAIVIGNNNYNIVQQFSSTGIPIATADVPSSELTPAGALQANSYIIAVGNNVSGTDFQVARYTTTSNPLQTTTITSPTNGEMVATGPILITGTAQNPSTVYLTLNGVVLASGTFTDSSNNWAITIDPLLGSNTISATTIYQNGDSNFASSIVTFSSVLCLHSSSLVKMLNGDSKPIMDLKFGDRIVDGNDSPATVQEVIQCWLTPTWWKASQPCLLLPKGSLGNDLPSEILAIDPGHPICLQENFRKEGMNALKPANDYVEYRSSFIVPWDKVSNVIPGDNHRYDLVLVEAECKTFIANGVVVQSRTTRETIGYDYYGKFAPYIW